MNKWKMNRAGLLNFWYYDEEFFDFSEGKLLLRGSNGSGKSVTMQSFLPVLLDGKKSPDRLDPFGSKARRMEDYLLGEKEVVDRDERTGYLFLEYKKGDTNQFMTTGIGLQAKRNKPMKFWGFVITDNRRIGEDIELYKLEKSAGEKQKIPRSRIELETVIAQGGHVVQTQKEYMELVNRYIFGFDNLEAYEDLIKLLIQLRSPKLSKDFRPTVIYEILEAALPPLTDEDLRHLSDTIEQMDQTKQQIEQLEREWQAIQKVSRAYDQYNQRRIAEQANEWLQSRKKRDSESDQKQTLRKRVNSTEAEIQIITEEKLRLDQQLEVLEKKQERLKSHKIWDLENELREEKRKQTEEQEKLSKIEKLLEEQAKKEILLRQDKNNSEAKAKSYEQELSEQLEEMTYSAHEASFKKHEMNQQDYYRVREHDFDFTVWKKETNSHLQELEKMVDHFRTFRHLKEDYEAKDLERAEEERKLDQSLQDEKAWLRLFEEDVEKKRAEIHEWAQTIDWLYDIDEKLQQSTRAIQSLYKPTSYEEVKIPFREGFLAYEDEQRQKKSKLIFEKSQLEEEKSIKERELREWREKKDPQPPTAKETKLARLALQEQKHSFIPFYAAVEFQEHVPLKIRETIEGILHETGMLDALIVDQNIPFVHDRILSPNPVLLQQTLADYLIPDQEAKQFVSLEKIDEILRTFVVNQDDGHTVITEDGYYQIGLLKGHALPYDGVKFIGRSARKRYRSEKIEQLEQQLSDLTAQITSLSADIVTLDKRLADAKATVDCFPNDSDLKESYQQLEKVKLVIKQQQSFVEKLDEQLKQLYKKYQEQKYLIDEQARHFDIEKTIEAYTTAKEELSKYKDELFGIEKIHTQWLLEKRRVADLEERLEDVIWQIDDGRGEANNLKDRVERIKQHVAAIAEQLKSAGVEDIRKQINEVDGMLKETKTKLTEASTKLPEMQKELEYLNRDLQVQIGRYEFWEKLEQAWFTSFKQEINYFFVYTKNEVEATTEIDIAKKAIKEYGSLVAEKDASRIDGHLTSTYFSQSSNLMEYRMKDYVQLIDVSKWMKLDISEEFKPMLEHWKQKASRRIIDLDYHGKRVSPYYIQDIVEKDRLRQEKLLDEQDQELYEDILFKSVGSKLRSRIKRAEEWTKKMNHLMETRDTSSGLTFSIRWRPRTAEVEEELDTKDLVELLMQNSRLLKEEDLQKITGHFRSKINNAKQLLAAKTEGQTLLQVLKEVLDYRKWFSFVLSYKRENEPKRELTNHAFYKFSGGEKAMAMYIPLFTACYSRYQEADPSAPYIISLDEAFAGVDENNIREMFEIVEHLGFNYIMNSQVLWGDYDTISKLAICELVRPKNADFVSVIHYHWDGEKLSVSDISSDEEELLNETHV